MAETVFLEWLNKKSVLTSDGATGTNLIARGLPRGKSPESWVLEKPEEIEKLARDFIKAGSDIILTSTFGGSALRLEKSGLASNMELINKSAVQLAKQAIAEKTVLVAGSMGPLGEMLQPLGTLEEDSARKNYENQAKILADSGADILLIETQFDISEARIAVDAALSQGDLPVICSFSFDRGLKTMMGIGPTRFAREFNGSGVAALGINCGKSLEDNFDCLKELADATSLPVWFKPNAGLPKLNNEGLPVYDVTPDEMASHVKDWIKEGARIIGGCCGSTPEHIRSIHSAINAGS